MIRSMPSFCSPSPTLTRCPHLAPASLAWTWSTAAAYQLAKSLHCYSQKECPMLSASRNLFLKNSRKVKSHRLVKTHQRQLLSMDLRPSIIMPALRSSLPVFILTLTLSSSPPEGLHSLELSMHHISNPCVFTQPFSCLPHVLVASITQNPA